MLSYIWTALRDVHAHVCCNAYLTASSRNITSIYLAHIFTSPISGKWRSKGIADVWLRQHYNNICIGKVPDIFQGPRCNNGSIYIDNVRIRPNCSCISKQCICSATFSSVFVEHIGLYIPQNSVCKWFVRLHTSRFQHSCVALCCVMAECTSHDEKAAASESYSLYKCLVWYNLRLQLYARVK